MNRRRATIAAAALVPAVAYEAVEVARGVNGWPYSRFIRLLPPWLFVAFLVAFNRWFAPHILRRVAEIVDDAQTFDLEETP